MSFSSIKIIVAFTLLSIIWGTNQLNAQEWTLVKKAENVQIYTRPAEHSDIKEIKGVALINVPIDQLMEVLGEVHHYPQWVYKTKSAKIVKKFSENDYIYHTESNMPKLISNRDLVLRSIQWKEPSTGIVYSKSVAVPDSYPQREGVVRIHYFSSVWKITPVSTNKTKIEYTLATDPGGSLPAWLVNLGIAHGPYNTILNLKKRSEKRNSRKMLSSNSSLKK